MLTFSKLLYMLSLVAAISALTIAGVEVVPPASRGDLSIDQSRPELDGTSTDGDNIVSTALIVDQKAGAVDDALPDQEVRDTQVTAVDGEITGAGTGGTAQIAKLKRRGTDSAQRGVAKRLLAGYEVVFTGSGTSLISRDGAIEGTAYLTYSIVPNNTYNVDLCLEHCNHVPGCVFANLYYEFNNELLDFVFSEKSNLKCVLYGDVHTAVEKTNRGGQQSIPAPAGLTYIQNSSGYASKVLSDPATPDGYELVFGPTNGANQAPGYMGFAFLDKYDVQACAEQCNTRGADAQGGACQYFNIWRALVNGVPTTYTCSMYYIPTNATTATNMGQGDLKVSHSRGYRRKDFLADGGFELYTACSDFCYTEAYTEWRGSSPRGGYLDASIFHYAPYAHSGHGVGLLGSATGADSLPGNLTPNRRIHSVAGKTYEVGFFHSSVFSGPTGQKDTFVEVQWNGRVIGTLRPGYSPWKYYSFKATGTGSDALAFQGGKAPAWSFIDDVHVFLL